MYLFTFSNDRFCVTRTVRLISTISGDVDAERRQETAIDVPNSGRGRDVDPGQPKFTGLTSEIVFCMSSGGASRCSYGGFTGGVFIRAEIVIDIRRDRESTGVSPFCAIRTFTFGCVRVNGIFALSMYKYSNAVQSLCKHLIAFV